MPEEPHPPAAGKGDDLTLLCTPVPAPLQTMLDQEAGAWRAPQQVPWAMSSCLGRQGRSGTPRRAAQSTPAFCLLSPPLTPGDVVSALSSSQAPRSAKLPGASRRGSEHHERSRLRACALFIDVAKTKLWRKGRGNEDRPCERHIGTGTFPEPVGPTRACTLHPSRP